MNSNKFISIIKQVVRDDAIESTIENLKDPPGRFINELEKQRSHWFNHLSQTDQNNIQSIITEAVDEALFGLLAVIDGVRVIEENKDKGRIELRYIGKTEVLLNEPSQIALHDLYNAKD